ncbi:SDR family oxidoreductase [Nocardioides sp. B-3]|uniref:SDR family oxidoreductase n=1 Tax=Nocardioides sp. B-3 TaxID=2895565 RepID=UPI0021525492|nr:NAD(P)-dependent oxidoreductase [Nocardioides sp. B-3]UUZ61483.1 NAD(P)-dependent oxidoreductase [Nocardioides sp. B-3]
MSPSTSSSSPASATRLAGRTMIMSGGSRGIGPAIGIAAAREGANVVLLAKTDKPDPRLPGTIHTAAAEIEAAGGRALAVVGDVREEESVERAVARAVERFGGIDIVVNNASALAPDSSEDLPVKRFDLMTQIQLRGTFLLSTKALPHLRQSDNAHILSLSPPLNLSPQWLGAHPAYTPAKYGMSLLTLGWSAEYADRGVAANCLWPQTYIATAAVQNLLGGEATLEQSRTPEIVADAAIEIVTRPARECTGNTFLDVDVLREGASRTCRRTAGPASSTTTSSSTPHDQPAARAPGRRRRAAADQPSGQAQRARHRDPAPPQRRAGRGSPRTRACARSCSRPRRPPPSAQAPT